MKSIEWLVLDVDDTLYLERDFVSSGFAAVDVTAHDHLALSDFGLLCQLLFDEGRRGDVFNEALNRCGVEASPDTLDLLVRSYRQHIPSINLCVDARHLLLNRARDIGIVLLTGGDPGVQQRKIDALELTAFTDHIVFSGMRGPEFDKPHPWSWEYVQDLTGCTGERILYVGDNPAKDPVPSLNLGWHFMRIRRPLSLHEAVPTPDGLAEIADLNCLGPLLTPGAPQFHTES